MRQPTTKEPQGSMNVNTPPGLPGGEGYGVQVGNRLRRSELALPSPALLQPGGLVPVGCGGFRRRPQPPGPGPAQRGLRLLPLVSRHGPRVVRGPGDRSRDEPRLRQRQGRPRGAARRRRRLHGGGAGADRAGRLADDGFLTPDGEPFHAGTYFPPEDRHGMPSFRRGPRGGRGAWRSVARGRRARPAS